MSAGAGPLVAVRGRVLLTAKAGPMAGPMDELVRVLEGLGYEVVTAELSGLVFHMGRRVFDVVLLGADDGRVPELALEPWRLSEPRPVPLVVVSGPGKMRRASERAMSGGAWASVAADTPAGLLGAMLDRWIAIGRAIRERASAIDRLSLLSLTDDVTGLYNQRYLGGRLDEELARSRRSGQPLALIVLDLDSFKLVNDQANHLVGTFVLQEVARLLKRNLRASDIICRFGGDEFVAILPCKTLPEAEIAAERLRSTIAEHQYQRRGFSLRITASLGIAAFPDDRVEVGEDLLRLADEAMYAAKVGGRDRWCVARAVA